MISISDAWRQWRHAFKGSLPYVRRRVFRKLEARYESLLDAVHPQAFLAHEAPIEARQEVACDLQGEVCLFVTHAPVPRLKPHVVFHVEQLLRAGMKVVLVVNTDAELAQVQVPDALARRLSGLFVRANRGYDFGAWAHVLLRCEPARWERLYLVNDSIVGPVREADFHAMLERIRRSPSDVQGLTEGIRPIHHLQSYFLVLAAPVLASKEFRQFVERVINFHDKAHVVDIYELRFTRTLQRAGFSVAALFPASAVAAGSSENVLRRGVALLDAGFPYVKTSVLQEGREAARLRALVRQAGIGLEL